MKRIITISREFGAGGGTIGRAVAEKLGYEYFDKEIILEAARESNIDVNSLMRWDEKVPLNFGFAQSLFDFYNKPLNEKLFSSQSNVIRKIGEKGNCVIVGRNANSILKEFDSTLHVFVHAPEYWRMVRMRGKMPGTADHKILEKMHNIDRARKKYASYYTNTVFGDSEDYDICLNTSTFGIDECIDIITAIAKK